MATAGQDFGEYRRWLEAAGVDTSLVKEVPGQVHRVVLLQHRLGEQPDRVVLHRGDGACGGAVVPHRRAGRTSSIISPNDPAAMTQYAEECRTIGHPFIFDPGQQCARMSGDGAGGRHLTARYLVICNDYELELIRQKTGLERDRHPRSAPTSWSSRAASTGSSVVRERPRVDVPAVTAADDRGSDRRRRRLSRRAS